ncbi:hypothetical protein B0A53_04421 [Rhodotorula sp. CCFEE 5036]|nr:hypothetical protein B0A53_04421 [Rhodotorula sp. CCFEE 5036]
MGPISLYILGVVLRKPKKPDYSLAKAYRLIAFEKTSAKVLESIVARRLAYLAEKHQLLPAEHFGGRQGRSVDESVVCFVDKIKRQWRNGNVVVGVALDVAKAFPSVNTEALCSGLARKGLPQRAVEWICSFMSDRTCDLRLEGVSSGPVEWKSGLPQGSPLSPILYLFYNAPALAALQTPSSMAVGWIDDINLLVWGKSAEAAVARANVLMPALEDWSRTHLSEFEASKSDAVLYAPHNRKVSADLPDVILAGSPIPWSPSLTMLGTIIDKRLTFERHVAACASKASVALTGVRLLSSARGYLRRRHTVQLVRTIVFPRLDWAAAAWFEPAAEGEREWSKKVRVAEAVHRAALVTVTGAFRSAATDAMEVEANIPPIRLRLRGAVARLGLRAAAAHPLHPLAARLALALRESCPAHPSPLHHAVRVLAPTCPPLYRFEMLLPHAVAPWDELPSSVEIRVAMSKEEATKAHARLLESLGEDDVVAYSDGSLMDGIAGSGVAIRALVGVNGCKVIDSQPRKGGSFDPTLWDCLSEFVMSTIVISAHQSVIHDAAGCKRTATVYWAALRNVYLATDVQGAQQLLTLPSPKPADVKLEMVYSLHLLNGLRPALSAFQTSLPMTNLSEMPSTDRVLDLVRNKVLRLSSLSLSPESEKFRAQCKERNFKNRLKAKARLAQAGEANAQLASLLNEDTGVDLWLTMSFSATPRSLKPTIDSGATHSMCGEISLFFNLCRCRPSPVGGVSGAKNGLMVTGVGSLLVKLVSGRIVVIHQALLVPGIAANLISSSQLYDNHGVTTTFGQGATLSRNGVVIATGTRLRKHLYQLDGELIAPSTAKELLELVHTDVLSINVPSYGGRRYVVTFVEDHSRMLWVEALTRKSDVFGAFQRFKAAAENESGKHIQRLRSDNGGEYTSHEFGDFLAEYGIHHEMPPPYSPQANGVSERINRTLVEGLISLLNQAQARKALCAEALLAFVFVKNRSPHAALAGGVPLAV